MDKKFFGMQLQKYRDKAGYTQEFLAEQIGCSSIFISFIERGEKAPSVDTLIKLSNALNISIDCMLGTELNCYPSEKLKQIAKRLSELPVYEQQKILTIFESIITIEINHYLKKE